MCSTFQSLFFIFLFESIVFVYKWISVLKRYFDACAHIMCSLCNHTNWNVNGSKCIVLSFFSLHFKIWIDTECVRMFSFSMESRYCLKWTLFLIWCSLFNFIIWWFCLISLTGSFISLCGSFDAAHWDFLSVPLSFINNQVFFSLKDNRDVGHKSEMEEI